MAKKPTAAEMLAAAKAAQADAEAAAVAAAKADAEAEAAAEAAEDSESTTDDAPLNIVAPELSGASKMDVPDDIQVGVFDSPNEISAAPRVDVVINTDAALEEPRPVLNERTLAEMAAGRAALEARQRGGR